MQNNIEQQVVTVFKQLGQDIHSTAKSKGWWDAAEWFQNVQPLVAASMPPHLLEEMEKAAYRRPGEGIALMHSELSEALEFERHGNPPRDHIPEFTGLEEEYADTIIRILDDCARRDLRIGEAVLAKMKFNQTRPYLHGGKKT